MKHKHFHFSHQAQIANKLVEFCDSNDYNTYGVYHPDKSLDILSAIPYFTQDALANKIWPYIKGFGINVIDPGKNNFIHIDPWFEGFSRFRLIFPIKGYYDSSVAFYESDNEPDQQIYIDNHLDPDKKFQYFSDESNLREIDRVSTETPTVIDTQTLHSARNPGNEIRIIAMIGLDASFDSAVQEL